jgi:hypothetical protein
MTGLFVRSGLRFVLAVIAAIGCAACTTTPTGTTKDVFDVTSSTTDRSWFTGDGLMKSEYKSIAFATYAYESVSDDMARGEGEYLTSMATLLNVPQEHYPGFRSIAQALYPEIAGSGSGTPALLLQSLRQPPSR